MVPSADPMSMSARPQKHCERAGITKPVKRPLLSLSPGERTAPNLLLQASTSLSGALSRRAYLPRQGRQRRCARNATSPAGAPGCSCSAGPEASRPAAMLPGCARACACCGPARRRPHPGPGPGYLLARGRPGMARVRRVLRGRGEWRRCVCGEVCLANVRRAM